MEPWFVLHRASQNRTELGRALASDADLLELDCWAEGRRIALRHDPLYWNALAGIMRRHRIVPWRRGERFWLDQTLDTGLSPDRIMLDIKDPRPCIVDLLVDALGPYEGGRGLAASTPQWGQLDRLGEELPAATLLYSIGKGQRGAEAWTRYRDRIVTGGAGGGVSIHHETATPQRLALLRDHELRSVCYTVNDVQRGFDLLQAGASGLTSDRSDLIAVWRDRSASRD